MEEMKEERAPKRFLILGEEAEEIKVAMADRAEHFCCSKRLKTSRERTCCRVIFTSVIVAGDGCRIEEAEGVPVKEKSMSASGSSKSCKGSTSMVGGGEET